MLRLYEAMMVGLVIKFCSFILVNVFNSW